MSVTGSPTQPNAVNDWAPAAISTRRRPPPTTSTQFSPNSTLTSVDLYGDSYGSFFAQTFTVRYPQRVRSVVLDGTYPIEGLDPWYGTTAIRLRENLRLFCDAQPGPHVRYARERWSP